MSGYWIRLHDRPATAGAASGASGRLPRDVVAELLGCAWSWWTADPAAAWEVAFRALAVGAGHRVLHAAGPPAWLDRALVTTRCERIEVDVAAMTAEPDWPAMHAAALVLDHRHALPQIPPVAVAGARVVEDATTAIGGSVRGQPVGALGDVVVVALGTPMCPRSSGAIVATARQRWADVLAGDAALTPLDDVGDPAVRADLGALPDRVDSFRAAAEVYDSAWRDKGLDLHVIEPTRGTTSPRSEYLVRVPEPAALAAALATEGVETRRPLNGRLQRLLEGPAETWAGAREFYGHVLQLPSHPGLDLGEILFVADLVVRHLRTSDA